MDTKELFSRKADNYAKYRWDYSLDAVRAIFDITHIGLQSSVADIGAGTGILTKHFIGKVKTIYAIEPNPEMRKLAEKNFFGKKDCIVVPGSAEATTLPDQWINLITVAQAIKWFDPIRSRHEFMRIMKPGGWLAILSNYGTDLELEAEIERISTSDYGVDLSIISSLPERQPPQFYYGNDDFRKLKFSFSVKNNWESYIGALLSSSFIPDEDHPLYPKFELAVREVFDHHCHDGILEVHGETELLIGKMSP